MENCNIKRQTDEHTCSSKLINTERGQIVVFECDTCDFKRIRYEDGKMEVVPGEEGVLHNGSFVKGEGSIEINFK